MLWLVTCSTTSQAPMMSTCGPGHLLAMVADLWHFRSFAVSPLVTILTVRDTMLSCIFRQTKPWLSLWFLNLLSSRALAAKLVGWVSGSCIFRQNKPWLAYWTGWVSGSWIFCQTKPWLPNWLAGSVVRASVCLSVYPSSPYGSIYISIHPSIHPSISK